MDIEEMINNIDDERVREFVERNVIRDIWRGEVSNNIEFTPVRSGGIDYEYQCGIAWDEDSLFFEDNFRTYSIFINIQINDDLSGNCTLETSILGRDNSEVEMPILFDDISVTAL